MLYRNPSEAVKLRANRAENVDLQICQVFSNPINYFFSLYAFAIGLTLGASNSLFLRNLFNTKDVYYYNMMVFCEPIAGFLFDLFQ